MDPASAGGLAVGIASLALDVFDRSVNLFRFFSSMVDMPKEFERFRLQLVIEYNRFLAWGDAVGMVEVQEGSHVASSLGTNAVELCSIVARVGRLLEEFKEINSRWEQQLRYCPPNERALTEEQATQVSIVHQVSSLAIAYDKNREEHRRLNVTKAFVRWVSKGGQNAKEVVCHPLRARWVMVDKVAFESLLKDLHQLIERIHELMSDHQGRQIHEATAKTYREMVVVRKDLTELKDMFEAVKSYMSMTGHCTANATRAKENNTTLHDLLMLKEMKCTSDAILLRIRKDADLDIKEDLKDLMRVSHYDAAFLRQHFKYHDAVNADATSDSRRPRGVLTQRGKECEVWIEWRTADNVINGSSQYKESILRTATLAAMLSLRKPQHLLSPTCIGFVDEPEQQRIGWIFEMPQNSHQGTRLRTLHSILGQRQYRPTLGQRITLAWKLASSLLYLHTADWLHKGVHSANIVFSTADDDLDIEKPLLSGYEYSRPVSNRTTSRALDPRWDMYRWPSIQNETPTARNSRQTHDIYSFGLLLLEIAHWQPLHTLMSLKGWPPSSAQSCRIRGWLLGEEPLPPFKNRDPLLELRHIVGDRYWEAARYCVVAEGHLDSPTNSALELHTAFSDSVVEKLRAVSI